MHYREADNAYFTIVESDGSDVFATVRTTAFPQSYKAMFMFCAKTNSLKTAMFDAIDSNNPYAFKVLYRCFCDHYLKFMYIFVRFLAEKSDSVGVEYYAYCGASEAKDYGAAISTAEGLLGNNVVADVQSAIATMYPEAASLSAKDLEEASSRFRYRSILRFLATEDLKFVTKDRPFLAQIVPAYALLSSFVHGGPYTDMEMVEYSGPKALQDCEREAEVIFLMDASVFMLTAMAVSREYPDFRSTAGKVKAVLDRFLAETVDEN